MKVMKQRVQKEQEAPLLLRDCQRLLKFDVSHNLANQMAAALPFGYKL